MRVRGVTLSTPQRLNLTLALVAGVLFVVGVIVLVPWSALPSGSIDPSSVFSAKELHSLRSYASEQRPLAWTAYFLNVGLSIVLAAVPAIRRAFDRLPGPLTVQVLLATAIVSLASQLLSLPFDWAYFQNSRHAGISVESTGLWWRDLVVSAVVGWVPLAIGALVIVLVVRKLPRTWPLVLAAIAGVAVVLGSLVVPVIVEPLFSSTHPLPPGPLRTAVLDLAAKEGVHLDDVVVADASTRTTAENAQVTGFGPTERMVLDDTLLRSMTQREVEVVVGHELGHAAHHDVLTGTLLGALGAMTAIAFAGLVITRGRRGEQLTRASAVPVLFALLTVGTFVISPLENSMSRAIEARADRAALAATQDKSAFVAVQKQLDLAARLDPTPPAWSQFWWGSHPTVLERISLAQP
ncbi:MAG: M48 family metalloprotease [Marmoricola sp.]